MTVAEILGLILGSGALGSLITTIINTIAQRKQVKAGAVKLRNEAGQIVLEGELRVTEFYKEQLEAILEKYSLLERRLNEEIINHSRCQDKIGELEKKYTDLQRQFTLLKTQMNEQ